MAEVRGFDVLQKELERTRDDLKDVDDNIKKLTGHDPDNRRPPGVQRRVSLTEDGRDRIFKAARGGLADESPGRRMSGPRQPVRRVLVEEESPSPAKRRPPGGAFSRLGPRVGIANRLGRQNPSSVRQRPDSGDEDDADNKPAIQSSVVVTSTDSKTREEALEQQGKDEKGKARNRRMFGALLGTLQRFKVEETQHETQGKQRKEVERKLEIKARQEKDDLRKEKQTLFQERRNKQLQLKKLQQKIELVGIHEEWVKQTTTLMNFIRTKTKPYIFYLPKGHTEKSKKKLSQSKQVLKDIITERKKGLEEEILELAPGDIGEHEDEEEAKDELEPKEQHEDGDKDDRQDNDDNNARDLRRKEKRERRRESRNSDHSKSPKKPLVSPYKDGATPKEQRRKRERRRESKEVHKKSTQNLEEKYKDEDGENWASGGEGEVKLTEDGMVVTEDVDEPADHMEMEETKKDHDEMDDDGKEDMDQEGEEEGDEKAADERDEMEESKEAEVGMQERLRTPPPPPLPPNVPYEPPLMVEEVNMEFNEEQTSVYEPNENQEGSTQKQSSEEPKHNVEEGPTEENVADIEVPPSPPPPPPPPPPPQPPSQKHHTTSKKKVSPKKAKHDARRNKAKNSKNKKTADIKQKKKKQQQQRSKKYKKRSRSASSSSSSSSSSSDSSRSGSSSSSSDSSSSSSSSSSNSSSSGSESD